MASYIKQLKDADGNNIYPIAYVNGGMKMDLLWTNPSPTSAFAAQTVSLDLSEYDLVLVYICASNQTTGGTLLLKVDDNIGFSQVRYNNGTGAGDYGICNRFVKALTTGVVFSTGYWQTSMGSMSQYDALSIPQKIYGIKMTYVVPTEVQGLEYEEI